MFEAIAASWPLNSGVNEAKDIKMPRASSTIQELATVARASVHPLQLQSALLAKNAIENGCQEECVILLCWSAFNQFDCRAFDDNLLALREKNPSRLEVRVLTLLGWLWKDQLHSIAVAPSEIWFGLESSYLLQLCKAWFFLKAGNLSEADSLLRRLPEFLCPEKVMLQASLFAKREIKTQQ